jgi:cardiolipin synthase
LLILVLADLAGIAQLDSVVGWMIYAVAGLTIASASAYLVFMAPAYGRCESKPD